MAKTSKTKIYQYGYDINKIARQIYKPKQLKKNWGYFCKVIENKNYGLSSLFIGKGKKTLLSLKKYSGKEVIIYLEKGSVRTGRFNLKPTESLHLPASIFSKPFELFAEDNSFVYVFSGPAIGKIKSFKKSKLFNFHNQSWADLVWTIVNRQYCGKKIFFKKGNNSSLHFHCQKSETYFIHSGKLLLRIRAGKGEDRFFVLNKGQAVDIPPGLIHQAGGLKDTVIMEVSTQDSDGDSFLVESEFTKMPKLEFKKN